MTDQEINAAIAAACNWPGNLICRDYNGNLWPADPPDFCRDLNAMHWAEQQWDITTLTARQRAEAFLRTIGKWEQGK